MVSKGIFKESGQDNRFFKYPTHDIMKVHLHGTTFSVSKRHMASRSAKFAQIINQHNNPPITSYTFSDIPTDVSTFSLIVDFCHGNGVLDFTPVNAAPLACLASFLEMTEDCMPNNLFQQTLTYITHKVLPCWNETIKMYRTIEPLVDASKKLGLLQALLDSIAEKVYSDPFLLLNPVDHYSPEIAPRRMQRFPNWCAEDLTSLSRQLFVMAIMAVKHVGVKEDHVARCLYRYALKRSTPLVIDGRAMMCESHQKQRDVIQSVELLLSTKKGILHVRKLSELLRLAISVQASEECRWGFEARIGNQLPEAKVADLIIPSCSYTDETKYDLEAVRRILNHFCSNYNDGNSSSNGSGSGSGSGSGEEDLKAVAKLVEEFLCVVARDKDTMKDTFVSLLEILVFILHPLCRSHDIVYRAIDIYFEVRGHLTESEREEVCRRLEVDKLSEVACDHAMRNERLPMRIITQVLFVCQKRMRDAITMEDAVTTNSDVSIPKATAMVEEQMTTKKKMDVETSSLESGYRVIGLGHEKKCKDCGVVTKKRKRNFWKGMRWKFGCKGIDDMEEDDNDDDDVDDSCKCRHVMRRRKRTRIISHEYH